MLRAAAETPKADWRSFGAGPRRALLLHCMLARAAAWGGVADRLGDLLTAAAVNLPGHGGAPDWQPGTDYQDLSVQMAAPLLDPERPADVIGHSFGATVALRLALDRPHAVRSLTLIEPVLFRALTDPQERARLLAEMQQCFDALEAGDPVLAARIFTDRWGTGLPWAALPETQRDYMVARMPLVVATRPTTEEDRAGLLSPGRLEKLDLPVLLLSGERTHGSIPAIHAELAARLPDARIATIAGGGHMAPITHPRQVAAAIRDFLSRT